MRKITKFASALLFTAAALLSCQKENLSEVSAFDAPTSFTASFESTKITIDGFKPVFEIGDVLNVTANNNATASFEVTEVSASGEATLKIKGSWSAEPVAPFFVYNGTPAMAFPSSNMMAFNAPNNVLSAEPNSLNLSTVVAKTDDLSNVMLLNASCLLKITVPEGVKALKIAPGSGSITSMASLNFTSTLVIGAMSTTPTQVAFTGNNGAGLTAGTYYVPLFPQTFNGGVRVGVSTDGTEYQWKEKAGNFIFQRNRIYDMGNIADWFAPEPKFVLEDLIGTYVGDVKIGNESNGTFQGNSLAGVETAVAASDNASKGNVKFTKFVGYDNAFYANFDLVVGTVTIPAGETVKYDAALSVTLASALELSLDEETKTKLSLSAHTVLGPHPALGAYGFNVAVDPFVFVKNVTPAGPTVADFVGKYRGGLKEQTYMNGSPMGPAQDRTAESAHQDFEFKAEDNGSNNVVMTMYFGNACSVPGFFDAETLEATFAAGAALSFIQGDGTTSTPLVLKLSDDLKTLAQVGTMSGNANPPFPFAYEVSEIFLTKQGGAAGSFQLSDVAKYGWAVTYKVNGEAKAETSGSNTTFSVQSDAAIAATGCNLYIGYFMCGYNTGYANFDVATGTLTIPQANNEKALYFPAIDWNAKYLASDIVMKMSDDKMTIVATGSFQLTDGTTITDYTLTRQ